MNVDPALRESAVEHLQALLRLNTMSPPGNEKLAADHIASILREAGFDEVHVLESAPNRATLVARLRALDVGLGVHWNLPGNPVDLEQREGRVHRYKGHAVRKNVAADHGHAAVNGAGTDPWEALFQSAQASDSGSSNIKPFWIYTRPEGAVIERYVPALPLSREAQQYRRLLRTVGAYRLVIGQPRQDDLVRYVGGDVDWLRIDLTPPRSATS